jgi:hypothetical protein
MHIPIGNRTGIRGQQKIETENLYAWRQEWKKKLEAPGFIEDN